MLSISGSLFLLSTIACDAAGLRARARGPCKGSIHDPFSSSRASFVVPKTERTQEISLYQSVRCLSCSSGRRAFGFGETSRGACDRLGVVRESNEPKKSLFVNFLVIRRVRRSPQSGDLAAQIVALDHRVVGERGGRALELDAAVDHDVGAVGDLDRLVEVLLGQQSRCKQLDGRRGLLLCRPWLHLQNRRLARGPGNTQG